MAKLGLDNRDLKSRLVFKLLSWVFLVALMTQQVVPMGSAATACVSTTLKKGATGTCVTYMQQMLNSSGQAGSAILVADGSFGSLSDKAVRSFQTNNQLIADGYVGSITWTALCKAPYTGRVAPVTALNTIKKSAGCADVTYIASPSVQVTTPSNGSSIGGGVLVTGKATDADGIANVSLMLDGVQVAKTANSTFSLYANTTTSRVGSHNLSIVATDNIGTKTSVSLNVQTSEVVASSTAIPCATGSTDLGIADGYVNGALVPTRLCAVTSLPSSADASNPNSKYYIAGANGRTVVSSRISQQLVSMVSAAKAAGLTLTSTSAFRPMLQQQDLCAANAGCRNGDYTIVAQPGYSSHQLGLAVDFTGMSATNTIAPASCLTRATQPSNLTWTWLYGNADTFGMKQYAAESWHWDATMLPDRCGLGQGY